MRMILASASPRRLELLRSLGLRPLVLATTVDEQQVGTETAQELVARLARDKGRRVAARTPADPVTIVLGADTEVVLHRRPLGKPQDAAEARAMLRRLGGREHQVMTGVYLWRSDTGREAGGVEVTTVAFRRLVPREIEAYVATGEPSDKAGAYAIQGRGRQLVERVEGSFSNVVGLPLERLPGWLSDLGVSLEQLATARR